MNKNYVRSATIMMTSNSVGIQQHHFSFRVFLADESVTMRASRNEYLRCGYPSPYGPSIWSVVMSPALSISPWIVTTSVKYTITAPISPTSLLYLLVICIRPYHQILPSNLLLIFCSVQGQLKSSHQSMAGIDGPPCP